MAAPDLSPGKVLGKFHIVEELGAGGMGIVYRAYDDQLQRDVAIKVLNARTLGDTTSRQRFRSEALILSRLNHPNVESVYEFCSEEGVDFLVLEYVPGSTLSDVIRNGHLSEQDVIGLGIQLARGLAAAHGQRVIHRDLKPGNLRVTPDNVLKVLDFGLAQLMAVPEDPTLEGDAAVAQNPLSGTPAYFAPEQIRGQEPDTRSDIYSAGVVLYELATGCKPFPQLGQLLLDTILNGVPPAPRLKNKEISPELEEVILKCLEKDPKRRYQSARELQIDLERLSTEHHPSGPGLAYRKQPAVRRSRSYLLAAVLALVAIAIAGFYGWKWVHPPAPQQKVMAVLPMDTSGQDAATTALGLGLTETVAAKLVQASDTSAIQVVSPQDLRDQKVQTADDAERIFGTNYVLESNLQRAGDTIRVNCYLVDPKTHRQIAAKTIESSTGDPFGLQDKVVSGVLEMMAVRVTPENRQKLVAVQDTDPAAYDAYVRGRGYMQEYQKSESVDNAIAEFEHAIRIDPKYALAYAGLGDAYWNAYKRSFKGPEAAARGTQACQRALALKPELVEAHICLANILNGTGKYEDAINEFKQALAKNPQSDDALRGLAQAYSNSGKFAEAESTLKQSIALRPNYWSGYHSLGLFYYSRARYSDALAMFQEEVRVAPDNYQSYTTLGGTYITLGNYPKAIEAFQRSIDLRPSEDAYSNLGYVNYLMHRFGDAINADEQALKWNMNDWEAYGNLADALYWSGERKPEAAPNYKKAIELASARVQLNPNDARTRVYLAGYLAALGDTRQATENADRAVKEAPSDTEVLFRAAVVYNLTGNQQQALKLLKQAADLNYSRPVIRDSPEFHNLQGTPQFEAIVR